MADRIPLIVNPTVSQLQELPTNDKLLLSGHLEFDSTNAACGDIISTGGNDAIFGLFCSTSVSNSSKVSIIGRNNANNGDVSIATFSVGASNTPELTVAGDITANGNIAGDSSTNITGIADITASGTVQAGNFDSTSDVRLKTNIQPIDDPIAKVIQIEGVSFNWKKDNQPALGVIADQVEKILPELVHGDDPKTVNYNGLIGLLIEVVKDQQKQINTLSERISKLE
mgnify:CR=1 FL=1